eukprot:TRINITY_DN5154_c0_g1_i14.p2 TRINITY_DN5154_c0_g1~~TRINITY_DN5154_c0_g1_i14.p2  ORF type:complete len:100 (-),score=8.75 TRINITY_DN5154_c0_g1_i14:805-1104(-)
MHPAWHQRASGSKVSLRKLLLPPHEGSDCSPTALGVVFRLCSKSNQDSSWFLRQCPFPIILTPFSDALLPMCRHRSPAPGDLRPSRHCAPPPPPPLPFA